MKQNYLLVINLFTVFHTWSMEDQFAKLEQSHTALANELVEKCKQVDVLTDEVQQLKKIIDKNKNALATAQDNVDITLADLQQKNAQLTTQLQVAKTLYNQEQSAHSATKTQYNAVVEQCFNEHITPRLFALEQQKMIYEWRHTIIKKVLVPFVTAGTLWRLGRSKNPNIVLPVVALATLATYTWGDKVLESDLFLHSTLAQVLHYPLVRARLCQLEVEAQKNRLPKLIALM